MRPYKATQEGLHQGLAAEKLEALRAVLQPALDPRLLSTDSFE